MIDARELVPERRLAVLADEVRHEVGQADADFQSAVQHAIQAGEKLTEAKGLVGHGEWLPWLQQNFPGSERTARNYMRLAANRQRVADLPSIREAVASLTEPTPDDPVDVREEMRLLVAEADDAQAEVARLNAVFAEAADLDEKRATAELIVTAMQRSADVLRQMLRLGHEAEVHVVLGHATWAEFVAVRGPVPPELPEWLRSHRWQFMTEPERAA